MKKFLYVLCLLFIHTIYLHGQTATMTIGSVTAFVGDTVSVPINVTNFTNIGAISLKINYNTTATTFIDLRNAPSGVSFTSSAAGGVISIGWFDATTTTPLNLGTGKLVDIRVVYKGGTGNFTFNVPQCEIANSAGNPIPVTYTNGLVSATPVKLTIATVQAAKNQPVNVPINVENFNSVGAVSLKISYDPAVLVFTGTANTAANMTFTSNAAGGVISLGWFDATGSTPVTIIGAAKLLDLQFTYKGGTSALDFIAGQSEIADGSGNAKTTQYVNGRVSGLPGEIVSLSLPAIRSPIGSALTVPLTVNKFNNIGAISLKIQYNAMVLTFDGITNTATTNITSNASMGILTIGWFDATGNTPLNLGTGKLLDIRFTYNGGTSALTFLESQSEIADSTGSPISVAYVNGSVSLNNAPGSYTIVSPATGTSVLLNWGDAIESRTFTWRKSVDPDPLDTVRYTLKLGTVTFTSANDGKDTSITLSPANMISALGTLKKSLLTWSVVASDGISTTNSNSASIYIFNNTALVSLTAARGTLDANGVPSTLNDTIKVAGVITTVNFQTANTDYMFQSGGVGFRMYASGIKTFALGDSIQVAGRVTQYYGHTQVPAFDTSHMRKVGTKTVPTPLTITIANLLTLTNAETHESRLIKINNVTKVSGAWPALGSSASIIITDDGGVSQLVLRIDSDTDIDGSAEPKYPVNITGVVAQFKASPPYFGDYQIMPSRREFDFTTVNLLPPATSLVSPAKNTQYGLDGTQNYKFIWRSVTDPNIPPDQVLYRWEWVAWPLKLSTTDTSYVRSGTQLQSLIPVNQASITRLWFVTTTDSTGNAFNQRATSDTFAVILNNLRPRITQQSVVPESIHINQAFTFSVTAVDPTNDPLTYTWFVDGALTSTVPDSTFTHTFTAPSTKIVKVIVADNHLGQDSVSWSLRVVSVDGDGEMLPREFALAQNYPNPFNPSTTIKFGLPKESHVMLRVYNLLGQEVACLMNETLTAGYYEFKFDASNLMSGIYFYKIEAGKFVSVKKMTLMK